MPNTKIAKIKKQWDDYNHEFDNSEYMDIEKHINMADQVGTLLRHIEQLENTQGNTFNDAIMNAEHETFENTKLSFDFDTDAKVVIFGKEQTTLGAFISSFYKHLKTDKDI